MHTLLRHIPTGQYFQSLEKWTPDRDEAHDFGLIANALRFAHKAGFPDLELVLCFDRPEQVTAIPFEKFRLGLSHTPRHEFSRGERSARKSCQRKRYGQQRAALALTRM